MAGIFVSCERESVANFQSEGAKQNYNLERIYFNSVVKYKEFLGRKFWGWECEQPIGDCYPNNGCVEICYECTKFIFWIPVKHDIKVDRIGC